MSYTYLQEQGEESLAGCFSDIPQSVLSRLSLTADESCSKDSETEFCQNSQSGTTSKPLTESLGAEKSTLYAEGSRAKTSAQPEEARELKASEAGFGERWRESLAKYDPNTHSWRTPQCSLLEGLDVFSETWPKWGMMRNGACWELTTRVRLTEENESGFWPTPTKSDGMGGRGTSEKRMGGENLRTVVKIWPTPQASDNRNRGGAGSRAIQRRKEMGKQIGLSQAVSDTSGALNPPWVEWLMGWPRNWTSLDKMENRAFDLWHDSFIWKKSGSTIDSHNDALRNVWWRIDPATAPQGWESIKQLTEQFSGALPKVPHCGSHGDIRLGAREGEARDVQNMPLPIQAEASTKEQDLPKTRVPQGEWYSVGRVALGIVTRADRLKAIGNGQVPAVAALAWQTLIDMK